MRSRARSRLFGFAVTLALAIGAGNAQAFPISGDQTEILLTSVPALTNAGLTFAPLGLAVMAPDNTSLLGLAPRFQALLPITGGETSTGDIFHDGSGIRLSNGSFDVDLSDFHLNLFTNTVTGTLAAGGNTFTGVGLFTVFPCIAALGSCVDGDGSIIVDGLRLDYSDTTAGAIQAMFGVGGLTGAQFGVAYPDLRAVPEPTAALLVFGGLAGLAVQGRRRRV